MKGYIYKITNPNGKIYIGQTDNINRRMSVYKRLGCKSQTKIYNSLVKYGWINHIFEIIEEISFDDLDINMIEISWIKQYDSFYNGLNCNEGGGTMRGYKHTEETKLKMSEVQKGRTFSEESKKKMSESAKGRKMSEELKEKLRIINTGRKVSEETKEKLSVSHIGKKHSEETLNKLKGRKMSEESKKKLSESKKK